MFQSRRSHYVIRKYNAQVEYRERASERESVSASEPPLVGADQTGQSDRRARLAIDSSLIIRAGAADGAYALTRRVSRTCDKLPRIMSRARSPIQSRALPSFVVHPPRGPSRRWEWEIHEGQVHHGGAGSRKVARRSLLLDNSVRTCP